MCDLRLTCIITSDWSGVQCFQRQTSSDESLRFRSHSVSSPGTKKILASVIAAAPLIFTPAQLLVELELLYLFVCKWFQTLFWISLASSIRKGEKCVFFGKIVPHILTFLHTIYVLFPAQLWQDHAVNSDGRVLTHMKNWLCVREYMPAAKWLISELRIKYCLRGPAIHEALPNGYSKIHSVLHHWLVHNVA